MSFTFEYLDHCIRLELEFYLSTIHSTYSHVELTPDSIAMHFTCGNPPMEAEEFVWGSYTRKVLKRLENLLVEMYE